MAVNEVYSHCYSTWVCGQLGSSCAPLCFSEIQGAYQISLFDFCTTYQFLSSLPLILSSLTTEKIGHLPQFKWMEILATVPTVIVAFKSKNLLYAVIVGIISMALIRFVF